MGRGKIEIKRIENSSNRQVTYTKRKNGIMKKANEITVLCDAEVALVIFSSNGKMSDYSSSPLPKVLEKYQKTTGNKLWDAKHEYLSAEVDRVKKENDSMRMQLRHLNGEDLNSLHPKELIPIEAALEDGVVCVKAKQKEHLRSIKKRTRLLEDENKRLDYICQQKELGIDTSTVRLEMDNGTSNGYNNNQKAAATRDFHQLPFAFHVHPVQPNLTTATTNK